MIPVVKPTLPPIEEYTSYLEEIWSTGVLTHNGPCVQQLEKSIEKMLSVDRFIACSNGTIALQMAIKALGLQGEIITTPFSWIATVSAIKWEGCTPVFCDIDPQTFNINADQIEALITPNTVGILPVHVFGNPCDVEKIEEISREYNIPVIYDAAHALGTTYRGKSVLSYGQISAVSLHATKILNAAEGGACVTSNRSIAKKLERIRFFGHDEKKEIVEDGFNGKLSELHAALGLANLKNLEAVQSQRSLNYSRYRANLREIGELRVQKLNGDGCNYSYFPIVFESEEKLNEALNILEHNQIYARRYFYPSLNTMEKILKYSPADLAMSLSKRILCLPLFFGLTDNQIDKTCELIHGLFETKC